MFFTGLVLLSILASVNLLSCISMNNQECKVGPQIVNLNGVVVAIISITDMQNCVFLMLLKI